MRVNYLLVKDVYERYLLHLNLANSSLRRYATGASTLGVLCPVCTLRAVSICHDVGYLELLILRRGDARAQMWDERGVEHPRLPFYLCLTLNPGCYRQENVLRMAEKIEIENDVFYVKRMQEEKPCKFAYLHLSDNANDIFVAVFENREVETPTVFWWNEEEMAEFENSRQVIVEFIGEAYLSLYINHGLERPVNIPLWKSPQAINCAIPSKWWHVVKNIHR